MKYDFDTVIDRRNTKCLKYDFAVERGKKEGVLPLWVADMDFKTADPIIERLKQAAEFGIYGYSESKADYAAAVCGWFQRHFSWTPQPEWLIKTPGVVFALAAAVRAFTAEGEAVLIQSPVYYPFTEVINDNHRELVDSPLKQVGGHYEMDFADMEEKIRDRKVKLFLLCSPHNPVGRVWTEEELCRVGDLCVRYGVTVVSDEIHSDFVWNGHMHHVFASLSPAYADISVTCTAPSKTFNLAGLQISNIFTPNPVLRQKLKKEIDAAGYSQVGLMGLVACQAAYEEGEEWLSQLKAYLTENLNTVREFVRTRLNGVTLIEPEGTYLLWLDFRALHLSNEELEDLIINRANLWLDSGAMFGPVGEGFERINMACPRSVLLQALTQLEQALNARLQ